MNNKFNHFDKDGNAVMVDVSDKPITHRTAISTGSIQVGTEIMEPMATRCFCPPDISLG